MCQGEREGREASGELERERERHGLIYDHTSISAVVTPSFPRSHASWRDVALAARKLDIIAFLWCELLKF